MIRVITKNQEVKVYNYHKYQVLDCDNDGTELWEANYHLYLDKEDASKFSVNEKVEVAFMGKDWNVRSISHLEDNLYCVDLSSKRTNVKEDAPTVPEKNCKLDNDCDCDCCTCEKELKKESDEKTHIDPLDAVVKGVFSAEDLAKLPKHLICIFSDGNKDTIAFEMKDGTIKGVGTSKRHPKDKFDFQTGADLAYSRLPNKELGVTHTVCGGSIVVYFEDAEEPLFYSDGSAAHVGDYVVLHQGIDTSAGVIQKRDDGTYVVANVEGDTTINSSSDVTLVWRP